MSSKLISDITRTVVTNFGHVIEFIEGVPTHVPEESVAECVKAGCVPEVTDSPAEVAEVPALPPDVNEENDAAV